MRTQGVFPIVSTCWEHFYQVCVRAQAATTSITPISQIGCQPSHRLAIFPLRAPCSWLSAHVGPVVLGVLPTDKSKEVVLNCKSTQLPWIYMISSPHRSHKFSPQIPHTLGIHLVIFRFFQVSNNKCVRAFFMWRLCVWVGKKSEYQFPDTESVRDLWTNV